MTHDRTLAQLVADHGDAVRAYVERALSLPADRWHAPRAPGKWSPAQETRHLVLTYEHFARDLIGEEGMRLKGKWWQRRLWRFLFMRRILDGRFPRGARAPREVRPPDETTDQPTLVADLERAAARFQETVQEVSRTHPGRGGRHPYFGKLSLAHVVQFNAVHTRHHMRQGLGASEEG